MSKYFLANIIASYFFARVIVPSYIEGDDYGFSGRIDNGKQQIGVFFRGEEIHVEQYVNYDDENFIEPDWVIKGNDAEAVGKWIKERQELDALF